MKNKVWANGSTLPPDDKPDYKDATKSLFENQIGQLLTIVDLAAKLQIGKKTIYNWVSQGKIPFIKINNKLLRFSEADIDRWISAQEGKTNGY